MSSNVPPRRSSPPPKSLSHDIYRPQREFEIKGSAGLSTSTLDDRISRVSRGSKANDPSELPPIYHPEREREERESARAPSITHPTVAEHPTAAGGNQRNGILRKEPNVGTKRQATVAFGPENPSSVLIPQSRQTTTQTVQSTAQSLTNPAGPSVMDNAALVAMINASALSPSKTASQNASVQRNRIDSAPTDENLEVNAGTMPSKKRRVERDSSSLKPDSAQKTTAAHSGHSESKVPSDIITKPLDSGLAQTRELAKAGPPVFPAVSVPLSTAGVDVTDVSKKPDRVSSPPPLVAPWNQKRAMTIDPSIDGIRTSRNSPPLLQTISGQDERIRAQSIDSVTTVPKGSTLSPISSSTSGATIPTNSTPNIDSKLKVATSIQPIMLSSIGNDTAAAIPSNNAKAQAVNSKPDTAVVSPVTTAEAGDQQPEVTEESSNSIDVSGPEQTAITEPEPPQPSLSRYEAVLAEVMALTPQQQHEELSVLLFRMSALHDAISRNARFS